MSQSKLQVGIGALTTLSANIAFQIGLATGHFKSYENLMYPLFGLSGFFGVWWILLWFRNSKATTSTTAPHVHVENKPEIHIENKPVFDNNPVFENKPTIIVTAGTAAAPAPAHDIEAIRENARREAMIIEFLKKSDPHTAYDVAELSEVVNLSMPEVRDIMERLVARKVAMATEIGPDAVSGIAYSLDSLYRPRPQAPERNPANTVRVYTTHEELEQRIMEFLKANDPSVQRRMRGSPRFNETEIIARESGFDFRNTWDTLERLEKKGRVRRTSVDQARGGALWALDDRED